MNIKETVEYLVIAEQHHQMQIAHLQMQISQLQSNEPKLKQTKSSTE
jgi:hypothetical protein